MTAYALTNEGKYAGPYELTVVFTDLTEGHFPRVQSRWTDNGSLYLKCKEGDKLRLYALPLTGIRMWHRELT